MTESQLQNTLDTEAQNLVALSVKLNQSSARSFVVGYYGHCHTLQIKVMRSKKEFTKQIMDVDVHLHVNTKLPADERIDHLKRKIAHLKSAAKRMQQLALTSPSN